MCVCRGAPLINILTSERELIQWIAFLQCTYYKFKQNKQIIVFVKFKPISRSHLKNVYNLLTRTMTTTLTWLFYRMFIIKKSTIYLLFCMCFNLFTNKIIFIWVCPENRSLIKKNQFQWIKCNFWRLFCLCLTFV